MPVSGVGLVCISSSVPCGPSLVTIGHAQAAPDASCHRCKAPWRASRPLRIWQVGEPEAQRRGVGGGGVEGGDGDRVSYGSFQCFSLDHTGICSLPRDRTSVLPIHCCDLWVQLILTDSMRGRWGGGQCRSVWPFLSPGWPADPQPCIQLGVPSCWLLFRCLWIPARTFLGVNVTAAQMGFRGGMLVAVLQEDGGDFPSVSVLAAPEVKAI